MLLAFFVIILGPVHYARLAGQVCSSISRGGHATAWPGWAGMYGEQINEIRENMTSRWLQLRAENSGAR
jgi:hypothetical protein